MNTASTVQTIYPGTRVDTQRLGHWCELWVDAWSDSPRRNADPDHFSVSILVHCFSRDPRQTTEVHRLLTLARETLARKAIPIRDTPNNGAINLGLLRVREPVMHDLSRNHTASGQEPLQHLVLVFPACAEECTAVS
ncbi:MAG: hypothetical protein ACK5Q5_20025 [Planctomycetaceae bacterium]